MQTGLGLLRSRKDLFLEADAVGLGFAIGYHPVGVGAGCQCGSFEHHRPPFSILGARARLPGRVPDALHFVLVEGLVDNAADQGEVFRPDRVSHRE